MISPQAVPAARRPLRVALAVALAAVLGALGRSPAATAATDLAEQHKLLAGDTEAFDYFGSAAAIDGDTLVVGAPEAGYFGPGAGTHGNGAAYVYRLAGGTWQEEAVLAASDGYQGQLFAAPGGDTVAIAGDTAVVGAPADDDGGAGSGAVYVFERAAATWTEAAKLVAADASSYAGFGESVSISADGETIVVGARSFGQAQPGAAYVFVRDGAGWEQQAKLVAADGANNDEFAWRVEIAQDTIAVSAWSDDNAQGSNAGAIYVFGLVNGDWEEQTKLVLADGQADWLLGWALAIGPDADTIVASTAAGTEGGVYVFERVGAAWSAGAKLVAPVAPAPWVAGDALAVASDTIVVGYSAMSDEAGGALLYRRAGATWTLVHRLEPSDGAPGDWAGQALPGDWAGTAVAMSAGVVAVGAPWHDAGGEDAGGIYLFEDAGWGATSIDFTEQQELLASDAEAFDYFGSAAAIDGDTLVVGAPEVGFFGPGAGTHGNGAAYVYRLSNGTWNEEAVLSASDGFVGQLFAAPGGDSVAIAGDTLVVGAQADDDNGVSSGAAYVFERSGSTWSQAAKLVAGDGSAGDHLGQTVSIAADGDTIVVGAPAYGNPRPGAAYVFGRDGSGWTQQAKLVAADGANHDEFGRAVKIAPDTIAVSAWSDDNAQGTNAGAIYVFGLVNGDWEEQTKLVLADGQADWLLGWALAISPDADTVVASTAAGTAGGVYVFVRSAGTWEEEGALAAPPGAAAWAMGDGLAVAGDTIVVGHSAVNEEIGGAYIYRRSGANWALAQRLLPSDGAPADWAGISVALSDGHIAVGSPWHGDAGQAAGAVYTFRDPGSDPDADVDGMSDDLEAGFGGSDPADSLAITNPETGGAAFGSGSAETGATIYSGSFGITLPAGTSVDTDADQIEITLLPGDVARVEIAGADLGGDTKSITMPFDGDAAHPAVCIDDAPTASIDAIVVGGACSAIAVAIPATVGASNTVSPFTVTRLLAHRVQVDGLSHTALATLDAGSAPPVVTSVTADAAPVIAGATVSASATFTDADDGGAHTAQWHWGDGATSSGTVTQGSNTVAGSHAYAAPGVYTVSVVVTDPDGGALSAAAEHRYVVVYDPAGGFVTGGGWIDSPAGALAADPDLTGRANFGFVARYRRGAEVPEGTTSFRFQAGDLHFQSTSYDWLVVAGQDKAKYKGWGAVNGAGGHRFMLTVIDNGSSGDKLHLKVWNDDGVVYDNFASSGDDGYDGTSIGGGDIKVHRP